jgi:hypothetical protein
MFEDLAKSNLVTMVGLTVLTAALPSLLPEWRPAFKTAVKFGITLLAESEAEAEAELIQSLVETTIEAIREELAKPAGTADRDAAVRRRVRHFKHRAHRRALRWGADEHDSRRRYRRHVIRLATSLEHQEQQSLARDRPIIADAVASLAQADANDPHPAS